MKTAKKPEQNVPQSRVAESAEEKPNNIIDLAEHGLERRPEPPNFQDTFVDHDFSPLNEW